MDEEAKQLLREIRDTALRQDARTEAAIARQRQLVRILLAVITVVLCAVAYLFFQVERMIQPPAFRLKVQAQEAGGPAIPGPRSEPRYIPLSAEP